MSISFSKVSNQGGGGSCYRRVNEKDKVASLSFWGRFPLPLTNHFIFSGTATTVLNPLGHTHCHSPLKPCSQPTPHILPSPSPYRHLPSAALCISSTCKAHPSSATLLGFSCIEHIYQMIRIWGVFIIQVHNSYQSQKKLITECPCLCWLLQTYYQYCFPISIKRWRTFTQTHTFKIFAVIIICKRQIVSRKIYCSELTQWHSYISRLTYNISVLVTRQSRSKRKIHAYTQHECHAPLNGPDIIWILPLFVFILI